MEKALAPAEERATVVEWARRLFSTPEKRAESAALYSLRELRPCADEGSAGGGASLVRRGIGVSATEFAALASGDDFIGGTLLPLFACFSSPVAEPPRSVATARCIEHILGARCDAA